MKVSAKESAEIIAARKSDPAIPEMNRYVAGKLDICWHEIDRPQGEYYRFLGEYYQCSCTTSNILYEDLVKHRNPDFSDDAGAVQLLREMMKREDCLSFIASCHALDDPLCFVDEYITTPVALLKAAYWWFKREGSHESI